jgi:CRP/FNR family transcriptional regulator
MPIDEQTLRAIPEFSLLSDEELVHVRSLIRERQVQRGEILFFEGEPGERLYFILSGWVKVFKTSTDGKEQVLRIFHAGETFNEVPVFDGGPNPASAMTLEEGTVYVLHRADIRQLLSEHPTIALSVIQMLASRLRYMVGLVEDLSFKHVSARVAKALLLHSEEIEGKTAHRLTQQELAALVGTAREVVGRVLKALEQEGGIDLEQGRIRIINRERLEAASGQS